MVSYMLVGGLGFSPRITTLFANKNKRWEWERNPFKAGKKIRQCQAHSPLHLNLFEGQAVLGVVTRDSNKFLTFETAGGFAEDEALALRESLL